METFGEGNLLVRQEEGKGKEEKIEYKENYQLAEIKEGEERKTSEIVCYPIIPTNIIPALKGSQEAAFHVLKSQVSQTHGPIQKPPPPT